MRQFRRTLLGALLTWLLHSAIGLGQVPLPELPQLPVNNPPAKDVQPEVKKTPSEVPDPTVPGPLFERILNPKATKGPTGASTFRMPPIAIKGRIVSKDRPASALLEFDGRLYLVNKDSILGGGNNVTLRIVELNASEVRIEVSPFNEIVILR